MKLAGGFFIYLKSKHKFKFNMKRGKIYQLIVTENIKKRGISIVVDDKLNKHTIKGIYLIDDTVEVIVTDVKEGKYYFSLIKSHDGLFQYGNTYEFQLKEIHSDYIIGSYNEKEFKIKKSRNTEKLNINDYIICKVLKIFKDQIEILFLYKNLNKVFKVGEEQYFLVNTIYEEFNSEKRIYFLDFLLPNGAIAKTYCPPWMKICEEHVKEIKAKYEGDGKWLLVHERTGCPLLKIGEKYSINLEPQSNASFLKGTLNNRIEINVIPPFSVNSQNLEARIAEYYYFGVEETGYLEFRQIVKFEDVIDSKALKVIAFDNLKKEYQTNKSLYTKLFSDYDSNNNLWVLSYGNTLIEVINEKIESKEWDIAYLLLEVLDKIESWILNSGYLKSFSPEKREGIKRDAPNKIQFAKALMIVLSSILSNSLSSILSNLESVLKNPSDKQELEINLSSIYYFIKITKNVDFNQLHVILQLISENKDIILERSCKTELQNLRKAVINLINDTQKDIFKEVFINPVKRLSFFGNRKEIKNLIKLSIWIIKLSDSPLERFLFGLKTVRFLAYHEPNIHKQEQIIIYAIKKVYAKKNEINLPIQNFDISKDNINTLVSSMETEKGEPKQMEYYIENSIENVPIKYRNFFGFITEYKGFTIAIPYNENKGLELNKDSIVNIDILGLDPLSSVGLGSQSNSYSNFIEKTKDQSLIEGNILKGIIKNIVDFGLFITIGGRDGLLHATKVSYHTTDLKSIFRIGNEIAIKIESISDDKIELDRLSVLKLQAETIKFEIGDKVKGVIFRIDENHGMFLELENGASGFINKYEYCLNESPRKLQDYFEVGEIIEAVVLSKDEKGYCLSIKEVFRKKPVDSIVNIGEKYDATIILINDLKTQIEHRLKRDVDWNYYENNFFCPKCQKNEYSNRSGNPSSLEIDMNQKTWHCLYCTYKSEEQIIVKLKNIPLTAFLPIKNFTTENTLIEYIGAEIEVRVEEIINNTFIRVSVLNSEANFDRYLENHPNNLKSSVNIAVELGFLYEHLASNLEDYKDEFLNLCRYYFGLAKMSRSYFHSFFSEYILFTNSLSSYSLDDIEKVSSKAKYLINFITSEELALQNFPILDYVLDSLKVISLCSEETLTSVEELVNIAKSKVDNIELRNTILLAISLCSTFEKNIREELWELLKLNFQNYLRFIQDDLVDEETLLLRKRIKNIIKENKETDLIECKSSLEIPVPSKQDLKQIKNLEMQLEKEEDIEKKEDLKKEIEKKKNPEVTKEIRKKINLQWIKTIAAFANSQGGELLIGIGENEYDNFVLLGIDKDIQFFRSEDALLLAIDTKIEQYIGNEFQPLIMIRLVRITIQKTVLYIKVTYSSKKIFVKDDNKDKFYIRRNASTIELNMREFSEYIDLKAPK